MNREKLVDLRNRFAVEYSPFWRELLDALIEDEPPPAPVADEWRDALVKLAARLDVSAVNSPEAIMQEVERRFVSPDGATTYGALRFTAVDRNGQEWRYQLSELRARDGWVYPVPTGTASSKAVTWERRYPDGTPVSWHRSRAEAEQAVCVGDVIVPLYERPVPP